MDFARTMYLRSLKVFENNKKDTFEKAEAAIAAAAAQGEWYVWITGAIDRPTVKHLRNKGYKVKVYGDYKDKDGRCANAHILIKWGRT